MTDILTYIQENMSTFSKGQKLIANYILQSYDKAAFMTASKLGKTVNVSESTVVRFAAELGFDGYPSMQKTLQEMIRNKLTSIQRVEVSNERIGNQDIMTMVMQSDIEKIRLTLDETDRSSFNEAVSAISSAKKSIFWVFVPPVCWLISSAFISALCLIIWSVWTQLLSVRCSNRFCVFQLMTYSSGSPFLAIPSAR